ncbi:MAG: hypothetical protein Q9227_009176 [Pyrenula ochraceoflavens]
MALAVLISSLLAFSWFAAGKNNFGEPPTNIEGPISIYTPSGYPTGIPKPISASVYPSWIDKSEPSPVSSHSVHPTGVVANEREVFCQRPNGDDISTSPTFSLTQFWFYPEEVGKKSTWNITLWNSDCQIMNTWIKEDVQPDNIGPVRLPLADPPETVKRWLEIQPNGVEGAHSSNARAHFGFYAVDADDGTVYGSLGSLCKQQQPCRIPYPGKYGQGFCWAGCATAVGQGMLPDPLKAGVRSPGLESDESRRLKRWSFSG